MAERIVQIGPLRPGEKQQVLTGPPGPPGPPGAEGPAGAPGGADAETIEYTFSAQVNQVFFAAPILHQVRVTVNGVVYDNDMYTYDETGVTLLYPSVMGDEVVLVTYRATTTKSGDVHLHPEYALDEDLQQEILNREQGDKAIADAMVAADQDLQDQITQEVSDREQGDKAVADALAAHTHKMPELQSESGVYTALPPAVDAITFVIDKDDTFVEGLTQQRCIFYLNGILLHPVTDYSITYVPATDTTDHRVTVTLSEESMSGDVWTLHILPAINGSSYTVEV